MSDSNNLSTHSSSETLRAHGLNQDAARKTSTEKQLLSAVDGSILSHSETDAETENNDAAMTTIPLQPAVKRPIAVSTHSTTTAVSGTRARTSIRHKIYDFLIHWCNAYRMLILWTILANIASVGAVIARHARPKHFLLGTSINIFVAVFLRQEDAINATFTMVSKLPVTLPLGMRQVIADLHHFGGMHIGCALSTLVWYIAFVVYNTISFADAYDLRTTTIFRWVDIVTCYVFLLSILLICITSHPRLRSKFHNSFEHTHRFGGWTALAFLWINTGISTQITPSSTPLYSSPSLWFLAVTTFFIVLPWTRMRRLAITAERVSEREVKLSFPYNNMSYTCTARFSFNPLMEWHGFATIPTPDAKGAFILISKAGDWTTSIINNPPKSLWIRNPPTMNFLAFAPMFQSLLLVGTGAGIGPLLSLLSSPSIRAMRDAGRKIRVMWVVYAADAPHWQFVHDIIRAVDANPKVFDSKVGRPEVAFETAYMAEQENVEAVMVVSNPAVTRDVVETCRRRGTKAYGAVFDS